MHSGKTIPRFLRPNVASLGYALFLATNATGVWGGVFPFLPTGFQTPRLMLWFFLAQSLVFMACYFISAVGVYYMPGPTRRFLVILAGLPYIIGWCFLIGAIYLDEMALYLAVAGGAFLGLGSAGFYMLWQRIFASMDADTGNRDLILGTALGAVFYFSLYAIPQAVTCYLVPAVFMPLFALSILVSSRKIDLSQPMFFDVPREHPKVYRRILKDYWRSALCIGALGFCTGIMRSLAIADNAVGSLVNALSMAALLLASVLMLGIKQRRGLRLNVDGAYRLIFPFVTSSFLLLPLMGGHPAYSMWQASLLYAVYGIGIELMMVQCAQASRDQGVNPVFIYGSFAGLVYALHDLGFIAGHFAERVEIAGLQTSSIVALFAVYLLAIMFFIGRGGFSDSRKGKGYRPGDIELLTALPENAPADGTLAPAQDDEGSSEKDGMADKLKTDEEPGDAGKRKERAPASGAEPQYRDRISKQAQVLRIEYRLSARETEVLELIARGNTVAKIAEDLVVSENTIRTHSKRIYAKLDIHKKQELLELMKKADERTWKL